MGACNIFGVRFGWVRFGGSVLVGSSVKTIKRLKDPVRDFRKLMDALDRGDIQVHSHDFDRAYVSRMKRLAKHFPVGSYVRANVEIRVDSSSIYIRKGSLGKVMSVKESAYYTAEKREYDHPIQIRFDFDGFRFKIFSDGSDINKTKDPRYV